MEDRIQSALGVFRRAGGTLRMSQALRRGITRKTLYAMRDAGIVDRISRGVFRLSEMAPLENPDFVTVAVRIPKGVICLISALAFHDLTTQIPHEVSVAIERGSETPRIDHPPIRVYRFSSKAFHTGIEVHRIDAVEVRIYSPEKTVADCFKYRNKLGLDLAVEALRNWRARRGTNPDTLLEMAKVCRVQSVLRPYLQALL